MALNPPITSSDRQSAGWDLKNAVRNYSTLVAAQVAVATFSFASVWLLTQYVGADGYGSVVAVIAASQVAQIFVNWTGVGLARHGVEEFVASGRITESFWARTAIFLPNTLLFLFFSFLWLPPLLGLLKLPTTVIWLVAAHFVSSALWLHVQHAMQGAKLPRVQALMQAAERVLIFGGLITLIAADRIDVFTAVAAYAAAPALMTIAGLIAIRRYFSWKIRFSANSLKTLLLFSLPHIPSTFIGYFSTSYLDAIFISQYLSRSDLAAYSIAYQINGILMQFPLLAGSLLLPLFITLRASGKEKRVTEYLQSLLPLLTFVGAAAAVLAAVAASFLVPLFFGSGAESIVTVFWILFSSAVIAVPAFMGFAPYTNAISATYIAAISATVSALVNFTANYFLVPVYGLKGCAWATVMAYAASVLVAISILWFRYGVKPRWTLPAIAPALIASGYASATGDLTIASILAIAAAFVIVLVCRRGISDGLHMLRNYRAVIAD